MGWLLDLPTQVRRILLARNGGTGNDKGAARYAAMPMRVRTSGEDMVRGNIVHCFEAGKANLVPDDTHDDTVGVVLGLLLDDGRIDEAATATQNQLVMVATNGIVQVLVDEDVERHEWAFPAATPGTARGETDPGEGCFGRFLGDGSAGGLAMVQLFAGGGGGGGGGGAFADGQVEAHFPYLRVGQRFETRVPYDCDIDAWVIVGNATGDLEIDVQRTNYAGAPPGSGDSIVASAPPNLTADQKQTSSTLTGWSTGLTKGDWLAFEVVSVSTVTDATVVLEVTRTS